MKWHDLFAKGLADATLAPHCDVTLEESVSLVTLALDIVAEPRDNAEGLRERGLLGRIAMRPCVIEPYSRTPSRRDLDRCMARAAILRINRKSEHILWVISRGKPVAMVRTWGLRCTPRWGQGVYLSANERAPRIVVLSELAQTRDTLLLRLMGRGKVLAQALADLRALPKTSWEQSTLVPVLNKVRTKLPQMTGASDTEQEIYMRFQQMKEDYERELEDAREQGKQQGTKLGEARGEVRVLRSKAAAVVQVLTARGFSPSPAQQAKVTACSDSAQLTEWLTRAATLDSLDAVFAE